MSAQPDSHNTLNRIEFIGQIEVRTPPSDLTTADQREINALAEPDLTPHEGHRQHRTADQAAPKL